MSRGGHESPRGYVYAIRCGDLVKIGFSKFPKDRVAQVLSGYPNAVFVGYASGAREHESDLFKLCAAQRVHREWFRIEGPVKLFVEMISAPRLVEAAA